MGTKIKHSPSAAAIGGSAYTIGRGEKQRWATDIALKQQALGIQQRAVDIRGMSVALQAKAQAAALEQREEESERLHGLREEEFDFRKQQQQEEMGLKLQEQLAEKRRLELEETVIDYSPEQYRELDRINVARNNVRKDFADKKITAEEEESFQRQLDEQEALVIPNRRMKTERDKSPEEMYRRNVFTETDGSKVYVNPNNGQRTVLGQTEEDFNKQFDVAYKNLYDINGEAPITKEVQDYMLLRKGVYTHFQGLATQTEKEMIRLREKFQKEAAEEEEQRATAEQVVMERDVASLPRLFDEYVREPKIGLKIKGGGSGIWDKVYGEETYKNLLLKAIEDFSDIPQEVIEAELDEWWLAKYEKDKGKPWQRFKNPNEFKDAAQAAAPMTAINPKTGELIFSSDGGKTWQKIQ